MPEENVSFPRDGTADGTQHVAIQKYHIQQVEERAAGD